MRSKKLTNKKQKISQKNKKGFRDGLSYSIQKVKKKEKYHLCIVYKYHHSTKLYRKISQLCCRGIVTSAKHEWQCRRRQTSDVFLV